MTFTAIGGAVRLCPAAPLADIDTVAIGMGIDEQQYLKPIAEYARLCGVWALVTVEQLLKPMGLRIGVVAARKTAAL